MVALAALALQSAKKRFQKGNLENKSMIDTLSGVGVDRLSAPILSIFTIIDIGHFQNRFADNNIYFFFYANKHTIYR